MFTAQKKSLNPSPSQASEKQTLLKMFQKQKQGQEQPSKQGQGQEQPSKQKQAQEQPPKQGQGQGQAPPPSFRGKPKKQRVLVAMSGGVDSSVAAALLVEQGYEVIGATMQVWDYSQDKTMQTHGTCCSNHDVEDARAVADHLQIPFYVLNCESAFKEKVIDPFIEDYLQGKTPLPCVHCNTYLKFHHLFKKMEDLECHYLATGHYARVEKISQDKKNKWEIHTSSDSWKDQTYFLFTLNKNRLPHILFPLGSWDKPQVRTYAKKRGLVNFNKKDSTGLCFVNKSKGYVQFIERQKEAASLLSGPICHYPSGKVLGQHTGLHAFTYGQRRGLNLDRSEQSFYVIKIDTKNNTLWVGGEKHLYASQMTIEKLHFLDKIQSGEELTVKIRFHHKGAKATYHAQNPDSHKAIIQFEEPQRAITPGQAAVFYRQQQLLGGGWILKSSSSKT